jgi:hypothetical protein
MKSTIRTKIAQFVGITLAVFAGSAVAAAFPQHKATGQRAVVVAAQDPQTIEHAKALAARDHAQVRVVRTYAEQLGATHMLAAQGYTTVTTVGVDERIAIKPVAERYPGTRFVVAQ